MTPFPTTHEARTGEPCAVPRRLLLESLGGGLGMLAAAQALAADASAARPGGAAPGPHFVPRARRVIRTNTPSEFALQGGRSRTHVIDLRPGRGVRIARPEVAGMPEPRVATSEVRSGPIVLN